MLISIVIPAYNADRFIGSLLQNLIDQIKKETFLLNECEIVIVNDGSSDFTQSICEAVCVKYNFIKLINQENKGESGARNTGIENSTGTYLYFLDSDDSLEEGALSHFYKTIQDNSNIDFFCFAYVSTVGGKVKKQYNNSALDRIFLDRDRFLKAYFSKTLPVHVCSCLVSRKLIDKYQLRFTIGLKIGADVEWILNICAVLQSAYFSNRTCFIYQIRNDSVMRGYKTFSETQFHSYEIRRDVCLSENFQKNEIKLFSNFWLQNQYVSHLISYLKSDFVNLEITNKFIKDYEYLRLPSICGAWKNTLAIKLFKILPIRLILSLRKKT